MLVLLLAAGGVAYGVFGWAAASRWAKLGLTNAAVVAADDSEIGALALPFRPTGPRRPGRATELVEAFQQAHFASDAPPHEWTSIFAEVQAAKTFVGQAAPCT